MRHALVLPLLAALLSGCASHSNVDPSGVWINQKAIDTAAKGKGLRDALGANGPVLEWQLNSKAGQVSFSNGFERVQGNLQPLGKGKWEADFQGNHSQQLTTDDDELTLAASASGPQQVFVKPKTTVEPGAPVGSSFEQALYAAYMGGDWTIVEGQGQGSAVHFLANGQLSGFPGADRYALCLAGDCATMSGDADSMWIELNKQGAPYLFKRDGKQLEIFQAVNQAQADEMPQFAAGQRLWLLKKQ
ncbi:lipoprotein [Pseudomonas sp. M47T1]|uniref:hypothetical protein n=1 Tax=unclassified Pseudomonas TaxID=196821 RepID=UPI0002607850|nr:hypothetical protein [Pseudomonas sp. M47T1]EIK97345.1 lipoprotein [Pseudomonas sp. M47T1]